MLGWGVKTITTDELADRLAAGNPILTDAHGVRGGTLAWRGRLEKWSSASGVG